MRPQCSQCLRKGRACPGYRNEEDSRFRIQTSDSFEKYMKSDRRKAYNQGIQLRGLNHDEHSVSQQPIGSYLNRLDAPVFCTPSLCVLFLAKSFFINVEEIISQ